MSVKFADKPCSERMAIVQSCQVQMIKNLEVVGAFSAKKFFPDKIIFDDLPPPINYLFLVQWMIFLIVFQSVVIIIATHFPAFKKDSLVFGYIFMQINANNMANYTCK